MTNPGTPHLTGSGQSQAIKLGWQKFAAQILLPRHRALPAADVVVVEQADALDGASGQLKEPVPNRLCSASPILASRDDLATFEK